MYEPRLDAGPQAAFSFMIAQASYIEPEVYKIQYPDIEYPGLIPIDTSAPDWVDSVTYFSMNAVGKADWLARGADDVRRVTTEYSQFNTPVETAGIGYGYDLFELRKAIGMRVNLTSDRAEMARRAAEEMINRVVFFGDTTRNILGVLNQPSVTVMTPASVTVNGTAYTAWTQKTPDQIRIDFNNLVNAPFLGSNTVEMCDTVIMPYTLWLMLADTPYSSTMPQAGSILEWLVTHNAYTARTGRPIVIRSILEMDTAGVGGVSRICAYRRDPGVVKMHMPMPFQFFPVWQTGSFRYEIPGAFRLGGIDVRRPGAFRYMDGC